MGSNEHDLTEHGILLACADRFEICKVSPVDSDVLMIGNEVVHISMSTSIRRSLYREKERTLRTEKYRFMRNSHDDWAFGLGQM